MLVNIKRIRKFIHYYKTDSDFKKIFDGAISYESLLKELNSKYTDLQASYDDARAFYCGLRGYEHVRDEYRNDLNAAFYDAGAAFNVEYK